AVTAHWTIYVLGAGPVRPEPGTTAARSDGSGRVLLCNVPTDVAVLVQGRAGEGPVGMVLVDLADRAFGRAALDLALAVTTGAVTGVVRRRNGSVIPGATVVAIGTDSRTTPVTAPVVTARAKSGAGSGEETSELQSLAYLV